MILAALTGVLGVLTVGSLGLAGAWYHDDQCAIAEWQCDAGDWGLLGFAVLGPLALLSALITLLAWGVHVARRGR